MLSIAFLMNELDRPAPFTPGAELWNDPHISGEMLKAHLSPDTDAASYKPDTIASICRHLHRAMGLHKGAAVVDLGCGPGLYAKELTGQGFSVTGVDKSENSIRYARELNAGRQAVFVNASYLEPFGVNCFDAAIMISKDYGVLPPVRRRRFLSNVHDALKPGGYFALDVHSLFDFARLQKSAAPNWEAAESGFWRPHPYIALSKTCFYPELSVSCELHAVLDREFTVYRIWQTYYSPESITKELQEGGFEVRAVWGSLMGDPLDGDSRVLGILCQKA
jgi:SAM-dependent methyltransferase